MEALSSVMNCLVAGAVLLASLVLLDIAAISHGVDTSGDRGEKY